MSAFTSLILNQLTVPPGDLIYYIVLVFAVSSALQSAFNHWRVTEYPQARRALIGLGILIGVQMLMFIVSGLGWQGLIDPQAILPPMDRAFLFIAIVWIIWLYAFPEPSTTADAAATLLTLLTIVTLGLNLLAWNPQQESYNGSLFDMLWQAGSLLMGLLGMTVIFIRRPNGMWNGILLLGIGFLGHAIHLLAPIAGNYSGVIRLAYMTAFPILLTLPQRFPIGPIAQPTSAVSAPQQPRATTPAAPIRKTDSNTTTPSGSAERRRYSTDPKTFHAMLALAAESTPAKVSQAVTRAIAQTMLSDLSFLIYLTDNNNQMVIAGGYDLIREESLEGGALNKNAIPMIANAVQRGRPLRMPSSSTSADVKGLGEILGLTNPGHLLCVPIITPDKEPIGSILLLSPYSDRVWSAEDQAFLANIATSLVPVIRKSQKISKLELQNDQARMQIGELEGKIQQLMKQVEESKAEAKNTNAAEHASMLIAQEESQRIIEQLQQENAQLRAGNKKEAPKETPVAVAAAPVMVNNPQTEKELKAALQQVSTLQKQLSDSSAKVQELEKGHASTKSTEQAEVIASISQELRQPLSSIVGYTDLLLGESVGILGALQRKFVERIKSSTERIHALIDDMIHITTLENELNDLKPETVDLNQVIDNVMSYTSSQVREKNISMHLDLPKRLAPIQGDREAIQQILIHLLQNAGATTPFEGTIRLKVETRTEDGLDYILIQVADSGVGISAEDLPRVFTRLYRADNVLIQGVGDTGVGLSIAKTLTEAHHGRIWVESELGVGSTFSVLLPISGVTMADNKAKGKS